MKVDTVVVCGKAFQGMQVLRGPSFQVTGADRNFLKFWNTGIFPYIIITAVMKSWQDGILWQDLSDHTKVKVTWAGRNSGKHYYLNFLRHYDNYKLYQWVTFRQGQGHKRQGQGHMC